MMGLSDGKKISMMRSAVSTQITRVTDGQTDGIGVAYTRYSIYVSRVKKTGNEMHAYFHKTWGRLRGERLSYLSMYLLYIVFLSFSQKFSRSLNCVLSST